MPRPKQGIAVMKEPNAPLCVCVCVYFRRGIQRQQHTRKSRAGKWQGMVHSVAVFPQYRLGALHSGSQQS